MRFRVRITPRAETDLREIRDCIARRSPLTAGRFPGKLLASLDTIAESPRSFSRVDENELVPYKLHRYIFRPYRIPYRVVGNDVQILHIRHGARRRATRPDLS